MGRLIDIENIDYVRLEDSLHCLEHHKGDEVECVICAPTVEAIPKAEVKKFLEEGTKEANNNVLAIVREDYIHKSEYEARLKAEREKIAENVANKMSYMGICLNERNIILGIITGKRETLDSLCSICKSESCVSKGTAISKADYENRLKADLKAILVELQLEIEEIEMGNNVPLGFEPVNKFYEGVSASSKIIQQKIRELEENQ